MTFSLSGPESVPPIFRTRIKRLLEIDRAKPSLEGGYAFSDEGSEGTGTDRSFTEFDVFCLALALDLLDTGFKQSEVVFLFQFLRAELQKRFPRIVANLPVPRQDTGDDRNVYLVVRKVELTEMVPATAKAVPKGAPVILQPHFFFGQKDLFDFIRHEMPEPNRKVLLLEIGLPAALLIMFLQEAPLVRRGPK